ncbi:MAG: hypothetical protein HY720_24155 [Planctomycetes bacterium]|nr:hypothetical protein [Planctomycetota bacterium]
MTVEAGSSIAPRVGWKGLRGLRIDCLGDCGPFSRLGDSIGYRLSYRGCDYLIDCGVPIFHKIGAEGVNRIRGILVTHSHDDHRRWLTDLALFRHYVPGGEGRPALVAIEDVLAECERTSRAALERTLTADSKSVIETAYGTYFDARPFGPRARFRIVRLPGTPPGATTSWKIVDRQDQPVPPSRAKAILNPRDERNPPRMLFRDPGTGLWVDPDLFYSFEESEYYEPDERPFVDPESGLTLRAVNGTSWHGLYSSSVLVETESERVFFSSDTVFDPDLWRQLATERKAQKLPEDGEAFATAACLVADINDLIEKTWSETRAERATRILAESPVVLHDVAARSSVVHTNYASIARGRWRNLVLVHSPDRFVSRHPLGRVAPSLRVVGPDLYEQVGERLYTLSADVYVRDDERLYVGFASTSGAFEIVDENGLLDIAPARSGRKPLGTVDLYRVLSGGYYPLGGGEPRDFRLRPDGNVEEVRWCATGSEGRLAQDRRPALEPVLSLADL